MPRGTTKNTLGLVKQAIEAGADVAFEFGQRGWGRPSLVRRATPKSVSKAGFFGFCHHQKIDREFSLHRLRNLKIIEEA